MLLLLVAVWGWCSGVVVGDSGGGGDGGGGGGGDECINIYIEEFAPQNDAMFKKQ